MKIAIVGPGALGCLLAGYLKSRTKEDIWLIDNSEERAKRIRTDGIRIEASGAIITAKPAITTDPSDVGIPDLIIVCVKSYSTEDACKSIKPIIGESTHVLTLQNGIGNVQILSDYVSQDRIVAGITNHGSTLLAHGHVRHAGKGDTIIGRFDSKVLGLVRDVSHLLGKAGFETKVTKDVESVMWSKLIINVGINALSALTRMRNGGLIESEDAKAVLRASVQEAVKVVKRKKIKLAYDDPIQKVESVCKLTAQNVSSMLQDVVNKDRTEIDFINGAIVRQAKALGIPTPVNDILTSILKAVEANYNKAVTRIE